MATIIATSVRKDSNLVGQSCPFCATPLRPGDQVVQCPVDATNHHAECWVANGNHCATFGCSGAGVVAGTASAGAAARSAASSPPVWEPSVMAQAAIPTAPTAGAPPAPVAPPVPRPVNPAPFGWAGLIAAVLLLAAPTWDWALPAAVVVVTGLAAFVEYRQLGGLKGLAPHVNLLCGLVWGGLGVALLYSLVWPYLLEVAPGVGAFEDYVAAVVGGLGVFIGAWCSSRWLTPDTAGLVRAVARLALVYAAVLWMLSEGWILPVVALGAAAAAVALLVIGLSATGAVLNPARLGRALLGSAALALLVIGASYILFDLNQIAALTVGRSVVESELFWELLLALAAVAGATESGGEFGLWLIKVAWTLLLLGIIGGGAYFGYRYAQVNGFSSDQTLLGVIIGGVLGLIVAVMINQVKKSLVK